MGIILKLDDHLTNMIAAGEVVERPMGVVKELVENAIDAKATRIEVTVAQGGLSSIVVSDNGIGMDPQDASRAFERHSTSKIKETQDLWSISTLGFRGEALPSIASVSRVVCMTNNGASATRVEIHFGKLISVVPYACPAGTHISVEGLFLKTPARLKHMKSVQYETAMIVDVIEKFTLCYPDIAFLLTCDGKVVVQTNGSGSLKEAVYRKYGSDIARNVVEFSKQSYDFSLSGAIVLPHVSRSSRNDMILFANRRLIRSIRLQRAIMQAYKYYLPEDRYPIVVLNINMDHQLVDVNVHPSKWEIRLSKEQQAELFITETIEEVLKQHMHAAPIREQVFRPTVTEVISFFPTV
jgi:DNA mismatch repair protein MutL